MKSSEFIKQLNEYGSCGGTSTGAVATAPGVGQGPNVGSLFGGSYEQPKTPAKKKARKK
jgi:hypothetical protein